MACSCIETVNEKLASRNTRLTQAWKLDDNVDEGLMLETEQVETGRGKPKAVAMFLTYCPFCGTKYGEDATDAKTTMKRLANHCQSLVDIIDDVQLRCDEPVHEDDM